MGLHCARNEKLEKTFRQKSNRVDYRKMWKYRLWKGSSPLLSCAHNWNFILLVRQYQQTWGRMVRQYHSSANICILNPQWPIRSYLLEWQWPKRQRKQLLVKTWWKGHVNTVDGTVSNGRHCGKQDRNSSWCSRESPHDPAILLLAIYSNVKSLNQKTSITMCSLNYCSIYLWL